MSELTQIRLKGVVQCSFIRSEVTNLALYEQEGHFPGELGEGEAFLFISKQGNQVIFVFRDPLNFDVSGKIRNVTDSRRLRLESGTWSPYMLQNYAEAVGLHLVGIKRFEQVHAEMRAAKAAKRKS